MLHACPTDLVRAPAERVWPLIALPTGLARWTETSILEGPDRELRAGDRLVLGPRRARRMQVIFDVRDVVPARRLAVRVQLPFGITNDEVIEMTPTSADACRVTFN